MNARPRPRWLSEEEHSAWRGLLRMTAALSTTLNRQLSPTGLSLQDYGVLVLLSESSEGRRRPFELGSELGIEKTRLSHHLARLEERGLVARERCASDLRGWFIGITDKGRRALTEAAPGHVAAVRGAFVDRLTPRQLAQLQSITAAVLGEPEDRS